MDPILLDQIYGMGGPVLASVFGIALAFERIYRVVRPDASGRTRMDVLSDKIDGLTETVNANALLLARIDERTTIRRENTTEI